MTSFFTNGKTADVSCETLSGLHLTYNGYKRQNGGCFLRNIVRQAARRVLTYKRLLGIS